MIIRCLELNNALQLTTCAAEIAAETFQRADAMIWIDLQNFEQVELKEWLDKLEIRGLPRRLCLEARDRPGFYPLKKEMFLVIPLLSDRDDTHVVDYLAFLCREKMLFTLHRKTFLNQQELASLQESEDWLPERSISGLVSALMIHLSLQCVQYTTDLRNSIITLEERMDREPDTVEAVELLNMRSELLAFGAMVSDQLPCLKALSMTDKPFFKLKDAREYMNCAIVNLQAAEASLDWLDGRLAALSSGFEMHAQDKTNRRLGRLTILSAIFNPATLLAGIWGMNWTVMPELQLPFGYPIALGFMALCGLGMYLFFRRNGWFD